RERRDLKVGIAIIEEGAIRMEAARAIDIFESGFEIVERFRVKGRILRRLKIPAPALESAARRNIPHQSIRELPIQRSSPRQLAKRLALPQRLLGQQRQAGDGANEGRI